MLKKDEENGPLRIPASGRLETSDYDDFVRRFERLAGRKPGTVPVVIEPALQFEGWDLGGLWRDLKFDVRHKDSFGRIAIVGDSNWEERGTKLSDPPFRAEMKFFQPSEHRTAEKWAKGKREAA